MEARRVRTAAQRPFEISLRIRHPSLDPNAITDELHLKPVHSFKAGQPRGGGAGGSPHTESYWLARMNPGAIGEPVGLPATDPLQALNVQRANEALVGSLGQALAVSVAYLRRHAAYLGRVQIDGGQVGLHVELMPREVGSFSLIPHVARALSEMRIEVEFEFSGES
jgi:hypothetical protein